MYPEIFVSANFFYADTKISASTCSVYKSYMTVHTYPIRIQTSQRISQQSMRITKKAEPVTSAYTKIYRSTHIRIHSVYGNFHSGEPIQKSLDTPSVYGGHVWTLGVSSLRIQKSPDTCGWGLSFFYNLSGADWRLISKF